MTTALLDKKSLVEEFLKENNGHLSAYSFANIFAWQDFFKFEFEIIDNNLCIFAHHDAGCFLYLPPLGKKVSPKAVTESFRIMNSVNKNPGVSHIENVSHQLLPYFSDDQFSHFQKGHEYCYYRKDIAGLKGNAFKSKRASYNHFIKNCRAQFLPYSENMLSECTKLYDQWAEGRLTRYQDEIYGQMIEENRRVHRLVLEFYKEIGLIGRVVCVDGKVKAYSFGYPLNKNNFCILFEIADLSLSGLAVYIFREFCAEREVELYPFINVMDDFELGNIQKTKMSFRPAFLMPAYGITQKDRHARRA